jgi:outer membrane lipoprotein-sorting protein
MRRLLLSVAFFVLSCGSALAQGTEFSYQGSLKDGGNAANGSYDLEFALFDSVSGGSQVGTTLTRLSTGVVNGIFTVTLDYGNSIFVGADRFLELRVRPAGAGSYTTLSPRQRVTSAPYSIKALNATSADSVSAACVLCITNAHIQSLDGGKLTGVISGDGSGLTGLNGANIAAGSVSSVQLSSDAQPNSAAYRLLAMRRWDLLKVQSTFPVGTGPVGIEFDGANMWVANFSSNTVTKLRASDGANLGTFAVGNAPWRIAFDGANMWVANSGSGSVTKLRASDGANLGTFTVGTGPNGVAFDGANIWVVNFNSNNVTKLRASDGANLGTFAVGTGPSGIAFDGANVWVANFISSGLTKLRASDGANLGSVAAGSGPYEIAFDGGNIWASNRLSSNVTKIRASDNANLGTFTVGLNPYAIAFDGTSIWTANRDASTVTKLRASDGANLGTFTVGNTPSGIAFDGANMWITNFGGVNVTRLVPAFPGP